MKPCIIIKNLGEFTPSKTHDRYVEVEIKLGKRSIVTAIPKTIEYQGLKLSDEVFEATLNEKCNEIINLDIDKWKKNSDTYWSNRIKGQTYKVLQALYSGVWECRVCGPTKNASNHSAARIRDLKKCGYILASKNKKCKFCRKSTMHDVLVMLERNANRFVHDNKLRAAMSEKLKNKIKITLHNIEVCFNNEAPNNELLIDHKFPSQRWLNLETANSETMNDDEIRRKFQLLSNRSNMQKSRQCDRCVTDGNRGDFFGIRWYFEGSEKWEKARKDDEKGCIGCPWHDLAEWKKRLMDKLIK